MMVKEITVIRAAKVNTGNYENVDLSVSMTAMLDDFDNVTDVTARLRDMTANALVQGLVELYATRGDSKMANVACVRKRHGLDDEFNERK